MKKLLLQKLLVICALLVSAVTFGQQIISTSSTTSPNACDGSAWFVDSSNVNQTSVFWASNGTVLQQGGYGISNLCPGTYMVTFSDLLGNSNTITFIIGADPCFGFYATMTITPPTDPAICDGMASVSVVGGSAPYVYFWDSGITTATASGLCDGDFVTCTVTDVNGCTASATDMVTSSNWYDSLLVINNGTYPDSTVLDSLGNSWVEDCLIDFLSVDSVYANGVVYQSADTILVNWVVIDTNGVLLLDLLVPYVNPNGVAGVYAVTMTLYCPQKSSGVYYIQANDQVVIDPLQAGLQEEMIELSIVNPFSDELIIDPNGIEDAQLIITDLSGRIVYSTDLAGNIVCKVDSSNWQSGIYTVNIYNTSGTISRKVFKY